MRFMCKGGRWQPGEPVGEWRGRRSQITEDVEGHARKLALLTDCEHRFLPYIDQAPLPTLSGPSEPCQLMIEFPVIDTLVRSNSTMSTV